MTDAPSSPKRPALTMQLAELPEWIQRTIETIENPTFAGAYPPAEIANGLRHMLKTLAGTPQTGADAERRMRGLRELAGFVEDGSSQAITIVQDDASREWIVQAGRRVAGYGPTFEAAIDKALEGAKQGSTPA